MVSVDIFMIRKSQSVAFGFFLRALMNDDAYAIVNVSASFRLNLSSISIDVLVNFVSWIVRIYSTKQTWLSSSIEYKVVLTEKREKLILGRVKPIYSERCKRKQQLGGRCASLISRMEDNT